MSPATITRNVTRQVRGRVTRGRAARHWPQAGLAGAMLLIALAIVGSYVRFRGSRLPYHDSFAQGQGTEWTPFGGNWEIDEGAVSNRSDEYGAKLMSGSTDWTDYQLSADLEMIGHEGDVGVVLRSTGEEPGVDSYHGYYVGLRSKDSALVIGRADFGWMEGRPQPMAGGVQAGTWYRLHVVAVQCKLAAVATNLSTGAQSWAAFEENGCITRGRIGLRSQSTGGAWKNVSVQPATQADYAAILAHAGFVQQPVYPLREDAYNGMRRLYFNKSFIPELGYRTAEAASAAEDETVPRLSIAAATARPARDTDAVLHGVVTLTSPLFIQDETGGIQVHSLKPVALNLGDEVQVRGAVQNDPLSPRILATEVRLLGDRTPVVPVSITPTQAATGAFNGRLVELRGILRQKSIDARQQITLRLEDAEQTFGVNGKGGLSLPQYQSMEVGSELRVRGICTAVPWRQDAGGAFTVLLRSMNEVEVLSGPPWWSPHRVAWYLLGLALLTAGTVHLLNRLERAKMRAIVGERERIAHEMHDTLAQNFAGVGFHLQGIRNSVRAGSMKMDVAAQKLDVVCDLVTRTHREVSAEIAGLHPDFLNNGDLLTALERCTHAILQDDALAFQLVRRGSPRRYSITIRDAFFQVGREAITNVLRHSKATEVCMILEYSARTMSLEVSDNGSGFSYAQRVDGFGLRAMQRRAEKVGGSLVIDTAEGRGTLVRMVAPYAKQRRWTRWVRSKPFAATSAGQRG